MYIGSMIIFITTTAPTQPSTRFSGGAQNFVKDNYQFGWKTIQDLYKREVRVGRLRVFRSWKSFVRRDSYGQVWMFSLQKWCRWAMQLGVIYTCCMTKFNYSTVYCILHSKTKLGVYYKPPSQGSPSSFGHSEVPFRFEQHLRENASWQENKNLLCRG